MSGAPQHPMPDPDQRETVASRQRTRPGDAAVVVTLALLLTAVVGTALLAYFLA